MSDMTLTQPKFNITQTICFKQTLDEINYFEGTGTIVAFGYWKYNDAYIIEYVIEHEGYKYSILEPEII